MSKSPLQAPRGTRDFYPDELRRRDWLFGHYLDRWKEILFTVSGTPGLDWKNLKAVNRFLGKFYQTLDSPQDREKEIVNACREWPPGPDDHMMPFEK